MQVLILVCLACEADRMLEMLGHGPRSKQVRNGISLFAVALHVIRAWRGFVPAVGPSKSGSQTADGIQTSADFAGRKPTVGEKRIGQTRHSRKIRNRRTFSD